MIRETTTAAEEIWALIDDPNVEVHGMYDEVGGPLYAAFCASDRQEIAEYIAALRTVRGDVLELAAGAGRLTLPLLASGRHIVATELSETMLRLLRERVETLPRTLRERAEILPADMRSFDLGRSFGAVVLGTTSISLLNHDERRQMFSCIQAHLEPGGRFLVTTVDLRSEVNTPLAEHTMRVPSGDEYLLAERLSADRTSREVALAPSKRETGGKVPFVCHSRVQVLTVAGLIEEAASAGFVLESVVECAGFEARYQSHLMSFRAGLRS